MAVVTHELDKIHNSFERLQYNTLVPCNCKKCEISSEPYSYPLEILRRLLKDGQYEIQCYKSYQMVKVSKLIDDVNLQPLEPEQQVNFPVTPLQRELDQRKDELLTNRQPNIQTEVFISYTWRDEPSPKLVTQIEQAFQATDIKIIRDSNTVGYKGRFREFMQRLSRGNYVIVVISDQYLKSDNCMYELVEIQKNGEIYDRIFPIVLEDAKIYNPAEGIKYVQYWEDKIKELDEGMKKVSSANLQGFREKLDLYTEIRKCIATLTNLLQDINALNPETLIESGFAPLLSAIKQHLDRDVIST